MGDPRTSSGVVYGPSPWWLQRGQVTVGQVIVNPLAETYWLLDKEDMLRVGWEICCCWERWVTWWWRQNPIGFYSLECGHSGGLATLFGLIASHPHDNGLWHQGPSLQGLMNNHDNKLDAYQTHGTCHYSRYHWNRATFTLEQCHWRCSDRKMFIKWSNSWTEL